MQENIIRCQRCGEKLDESKVVYLNYIRDTDTYTDQPNENGPEYDELFSFGAACAKTTLNKHGGKIQKYVR